MTTVYTGARVFTAGEPAWADAVAVVGDRIACVGTEADAREAAGPGAEVVELDGGVVLPGFVDGQGDLGGRPPGEVVLPSLGEQLVAGLFDAVSQVEPGRTFGDQGPMPGALTLRDDGRGGADPAGGSGLVGLEDRAEALGGWFWVETAPGAGSSVHAELPLGPAEAATPQGIHSIG